MDSSSSHQSFLSVTTSLPLDRSLFDAAIEDEGADAATVVSSWRRTPFSRSTRIAAVCFALVAFVVTQRHVTGGSSPSVPGKNGPEKNQKKKLFPFSSATITPVPHVLRLRSLEQNNGDDGAANQQGNNERNREPGNDDFFDDFIQDDLVANNATRVYDDFYLFDPDHRKTPKLFPLETETILGFFVASLAIGLGASSGTGGGGTLVPIYILIIGLPIQVAIPIGAVTVLGGAIASTSLNWTRRHPLTDRVLIDWDIVLVMEPLTLVGALLGTLFHRLLSEKLLVVMLVLLLSITAHTTLSKAMRMYQAEIRYIRHLRAAQSEIGNSPSSITKTDTWGAFESEALAGGPKRDPRHLDPVEKEQILIMNPDFVTLRSELIQQEKFTPRSKIIALCCMFSVFIFLNIMVGGGAYKSPWDIGCGSVAFWTVHVIMIAFLIASAWAAHSYVVARFEIKELLRFDYVHGDIKWNTPTSFMYPAVFVTAGLFAGTLGIGGGSEYRAMLFFIVCERVYAPDGSLPLYHFTVITVPIMFAMGVHPAVVAATSSAMILFTSLASTTSFFVFGLILPDFAIMGFVVGFVSAFLGASLMRQARQARSASGRDFERNSFTAFALGAVILISALLMTIEVNLSDLIVMRQSIVFFLFLSNSIVYFLAVRLYYCGTTGGSRWTVRRLAILLRKPI